MAQKSRGKIYNYKQDLEDKIRVFANVALGKILPTIPKERKELDKKSRQKIN